VQGLETINPWKLPKSNLGSQMRSLDQIFLLSDAVPDPRRFLISDHATTDSTKNSKWLPKQPKEQGVIEVIFVIIDLLTCNSRSNRYVRASLQIFPSN